VDDVPVGERGRLFDALAVDSGTVEGVDVADEPLVPSVIHLRVPAGSVFIVENDRVAPIPPERDGTLRQQLTTGRGALPAFDD
jgi:hypothetical protein